MATLTIIKNNPSNLELIYSTRLAFLSQKWDELMSEQKDMNIDEICSQDFQNKKLRIGGLYQRITKKIQANKKPVSVTETKNYNNDGAAEWYGQGRYMAD